MEIFCLGLSHKSAPLSVRERLALSPEAAVQAMSRLGPAAAEAMLLSTCNRVEFYVSAPSTEGAARVLRELVTQMAGADSLDHLYEHRSDAALVHLFRVASSLDSMVVGEPQILGQVKDAFELAKGNGFAKGEIERACSAAFACAKRVRSETGVGRAATSMASAAVALAGKLFGDLSDNAVLLVGAGEMSQLAGKHLVDAGVKKLQVVNRTLSRAEELAASLGAKARPFEEVFSALAEVDVVICSTASSIPIFTAANVQPVLRARKHRPLFMVDLAVPRDIAADVGQLRGVYAYDVDDIEKVLEENAAARAAEAAKAEVIVAEEIAHFMRSKAVRDGVPVLGQLRARAEQIARAEAAKTLSAIGGALSDKQKKSVEAMALAIVNKLLHQPTAKLRAVGPDEASSQLADAAAELFGLTPAPSSEEESGDEPSDHREGGEPELAVGRKP